MIWLTTISGPRSMILIAHDQLFPSIASANRLWGLARQAEVQVHTIFIESNENERRVSDFARRLRSGIGSAFHQDQTHIELRLAIPVASADATGEACIANDESTGLAAVSTIAAEILNVTNQGSQPEARSECVPWLTDLSQR